MIRQWLVGLVALAATAVEAGAPVELFNGKDLSGWYKFLKGYGRDNDPQNVISVTNGVIRITGETWGALVTEKEYADYRLDVEYRWTGKKWPSKAKAALDSGILFHSTGPDGGFAGIWMYSHELNVIYGACGDIWTVGSKEKRPDMYVKSTAAKVVDGKRTYFRYDPQGEAIVLTGNNRLARQDIDPSWTDTPEAKAAVNENPIGEWNTATLVCRGDEVECFFNGKLVNRATVCPARGKIQLQSEGCEVEYRRVTLTSLAPAPEAAFANPPQDAKPQTWFHLIGGNVSKEGLTADLTALRDAGFGGIQLFHGQVGADSKWPRTGERIPCLSAKWDEIIVHAADECARLGLKFEMQNCPGWSMSGGPWITPDKAMRKLVWFEPGKRPDFKADDDYHEIGEVTFPRPKGWGEPDLVPASVTGDVNARTFDFGRPVTVRTLVLPPPRNLNNRMPYVIDIGVMFEAETASGWKTVLDRKYPRGCWQDDVDVSFACGETAARRWRLTYRAAQPVQSAKVTFSPVSRLDGWEALGGWVYHDLPPCGTAAGRYGRDAGTVTLVFGHVNMKRTNHPAPAEATGWECDKLDARGCRANFDGYLGRLVKGPLGGGRLKGFVVDSWECTRQSWTWRMEEEFRRLNGYELRPNLPTLLGFPAGDPADGERFLRDWRRTVSTLIEENYYRTFSELGRRHGLTVQFETAFADVLPGDPLRYWKYADIPMCEFWQPFDNAKGSVGSDNYKPTRPCVSAAHVYGKRRVQAESFTSFALTYDENFKLLKGVADRHFARGVTHLVFHTYTHQPQTGADFLPPGTSFGAKIGTPFLRGQTWWKFLPQFTAYLARCGAALERGLPVVDVLWYLGDEIGFRPDENAPFPDGYKFDYCNFDVLTTRLDVRDGRFVLPDGMSYRVLWIPTGTFLLPETEKRLAALAAKGGRIVRGELTPDWPSPLEKLGFRPQAWYQRREGETDVFFVVRDSGETEIVTLEGGRKTVFDPVTGAVRADWKNVAKWEVETPVALRPAEDYPAWATSRTYVGTVAKPSSAGPAVLSLGDVRDWAEVYVNGRKAATLWCEPYACDLGPFLKDGANEIRVDVTSTWYNRLVHDAGLPEAERKTWTVAGPAADAAFHPSGLLGPSRLFHKAEGGRPSLEEGFVSPPHAAKPHTWYHLMNGNVTKDGITRDFEELAAAGIGGVQMFDAGCAIPAGPVKFNSPDWFDLLRHAASEAQRLGLEVCLPNCSGWSSSGGPWNPASNAMKKVVFTETRVKGGATFAGKLAKPKDPCGFYGDVAVLALPVPAANLATYDGQRFEKKGETVTVVSDRPIEASGYSLKVEFSPIWRAYAYLTIELSRDGTTFEPYAEKKIALCLSGRGSRDYRYFSFERPMTLRGLRISLRYENGTSSVRRAVQAQATGLRLERKLAISSLDCKTVDMRGDLEPPTFEAASDQAVPRASVVELTNAMKADGTLVWSAPATAAEWALVRLGYATIPVYNHPASQYGRGFEVDKLSAAAMNYHFEQYVGPLCRLLGPLAGGATGLNNILVDSYEVGSQNWTQGLADEFRRRRGYDLTAYLPVFAGYIVGGVDETERFLWDFRRVVADLFAENYAGALAKKCHQYGLRLSLEPYGSGPFDNLQYGRYADIPMGEFWSMSKHPGYFGGAGNAKYVASVGHVWGKPFVGTESFTANPVDSGAWLTTPELIKPIGDAAFADGVNRIIYHRFVHQPWADDRYVPGLTMGQWGMHFDRHNTWWPYAREFLRYQARCQFLLQQGEHVADVLFWCGEDAPNQGGNTDGGNVCPYVTPAGYDDDVCETEALLRLRVENGRLVAPGGAKYRLLVLPPSRTMTPEALSKVGALVKAGAKVAGPVRPTAVPGLRGWPAADGALAAQAKEIWSAGVLEADVAAALKALGIEPDVRCANGAKWDHRRTADADIYFVCRNNERRETFDCSFRISGRRPEIWDAETGAIAAPPAWRVEGGRTVVTLDFETCGSAFVVFRDTPSKGLKPFAASESKSVQEVGGAWEVSFAAKYEGAPKPRTFEKLVSWTESDDPDLKYLSGSATYEKTVEIAPPAAGERIVLDLGEVKNFAEVTVNGHAFPVLWKPPYRIDVTEALACGEGVRRSAVRLAVKVTNLWPNRLIGDDALPADVEWKKPEGAYQPVKEIPQWVKDGKKSPTGRHTFTTWRFWKADDPLLPSGLLGPVRICVSLP